MIHCESITIAELGEVTAVCLFKFVTAKLSKWRVKMSDLLDFFSNGLEFLFSDPRQGKKAFSPYIKRSSWQRGLRKKNLPFAVQLVIQLTENLKNRLNYALRYGLQSNIDEDK